MMKLMCRFEQKTIYILLHLGPNSKYQRHACTEELLNMEGICANQPIPDQISS